MVVAEEKTCTRCHVPKSLDDFYRDSASPDGRTNWCIACRTEYRAEVYARDPQAAKDYARQWKRDNPKKVSEYGRRHRHGVEPEDFDAMVAAQDGRCAICLIETDDLRVDHCHDRKVIRGLLCDRCNRGAGYFNHDPEALMRAAAYVQREGVMPHSPRAQSH